MSKKTIDYLDWCALGFGLVALIYYVIVKPWLGIPDYGISWLPITIAALLGLTQISIAIYAFAVRRPTFDWHMVYGRFLVKTISIVILVPFIIAIFAQLSKIGQLTPSSADYEGSLVWSIFSHFVDPGNTHSVGNNVGWATLIALLGVFLLNGLLVASVIGWIESRKTKWLSGAITYDGFMRKTEHYVIVGGNDMVAGIVEQIFSIHRAESKAKGRAEASLPYILIQTSRDVDAFRMELYSNLTEEEQRHIIIYYGNRNSPCDIAKLEVNSAKEVYIIGENIRTDDVDSYHDTMNIECMELIRQELKPQNNKLTCRVMFEYQTTFSVFQFSEISSDIKSYIDFRPFNYYDIWAQKVLTGRDTTNYLPLEGTEAIGPDSERYVHLFVIGMSRMGVAMAINAAHFAHYPNFVSKGIRTKITFIDKKAHEEKDFFMGRFKNLFALSNWRYGTIEEDKLTWSDKEKHTPSAEYNHLGGDFLDIEWEFIRGSVEKKAVQDYICAAINNPNSSVNIAICQAEQNRCLATALYFDKEIYSRVNQILIYNRYGDSLVRQMTHKGSTQFNPYHNKLRAFGMANEFYDLDLGEDIAFIAQQSNEAYTSISEEIEKSLGTVDEGKNLYGKSDAAKMWSNIYSASTAWCKMRSIGWDGNRDLNDDEIAILAQVEHARWNMEQLLMGYRPLTKEEQQEVQNDLTRKNPLKSQMAHFNICSFDKLKEIDCRTIKIDEKFVKIIPEALRKLREKRN